MKNGLKIALELQNWFWSFWWKKLPSIYFVVKFKKEPPCNQKVIKVENQFFQRLTESFLSKSKMDGKAIKVM